MMHAIVLPVAFITRAKESNTSRKRGCRRRWAEVAEYHHEVEEFVFL